MNERQPRSPEEWEAIEQLRTEVEEEQEEFDRWLNQKDDMWS